MMFDILVYLFENYFEADLHPDQPTLEQELSAAGFDTSEIGRAFDWLNGLEILSSSPYPENLALSKSTRIYSEVEIKVINTEGRGFLAFLEASGILNAVQREWVIDRVLALSDQEIPVDQIKWIVLIVLWSRGEADDYLFIEDLLFSDNTPQMH
jgi:Smg protein